MPFTHRAGRTVAAAAASFLCVLVVSTIPSPASAYSGFTRAQGSIYAKLAASTMTSNDFYDRSGKLNDSGQALTQRALSLYAEYGILDELTVTLDVPLLEANSYANSGTVYGFGDTSIEARYGLSFGRLHVAASVAPSLPTGRDEAETKTDSGLGVVLPTGDGEFNVWVNLAISYSLGISRLDWLSGWATIGAGYNIRTSGYADQIGYGAELGTTWWDLVQLKVLLQGQTVPTPSEELTFSGFIYGDGTEFVSFGAGLALLLPETPVALTLDWQKPFFAQRNLYGGSVFWAGASFQWPD